MTPLSTFYHQAADDHERARIRRAAWLFARSCRFDVARLRRYLQQTEEVFALRVMTPGEQRDLEITRLAVEMAERRAGTEVAA